MRIWQIIFPPQLYQWDAWIHKWPVGPLVIAGDRANKDTWAATTLLPSPLMNNTSIENLGFVILTVLILFKQKTTKEEFTYLCCSHLKAILSFLLNYLGQHLLSVDLNKLSFMLPFRDNFNKVCQHEKPTVSAHLFLQLTSHFSCQI